MTNATETARRNKVPDHPAWPVCPTWCAISIEEHIANERSFDGGWCHRSRNWEVVDCEVAVASVTGGEYPEQPPLLTVDGSPCDMTLLQARELAALIEDIADLVEGRADV